MCVLESLDAEIRALLSIVTTSQLHHAKQMAEKNKQQEQQAAGGPDLSPSSSRFFRLSPLDAPARLALSSEICSLLTALRSTTCQHGVSTLHTLTQNTPRDRHIIQYAQTQAAIRDTQQQGHDTTAAPASSSLSSAPSSRLPRPCSPRPRTSCSLSSSSFLLCDVSLPVPPDSLSVSTVDALSAPLRVALKREKEALMQDINYLQACMDIQAERVVELEEKQKQKKQNELSSPSSPADDDPSSDTIPSLSELRSVSIQLAAAVASEQSRAHTLALIHSVPAISRNITNKDLNTGMKNTQTASYQHSYALTPVIRASSGSRKRPTMPHPNGSPVVARPLSLPISYTSTSAPSSSRSGTSCSSPSLSPSLSSSPSPSSPPLPVCDPPPISDLTTIADLLCEIERIDAVHTNLGRYNTNNKQQTIQTREHTQSKHMDKEEGDTLFFNQNQAMHVHDDQKQQGHPSSLSTHTSSSPSFSPVQPSSFSRPRSRPISHDRPLSSDVPLSVSPSSFPSSLPVNLVPSDSPVFHISTSQHTQRDRRSAQQNIYDITHTHQGREVNTGKDGASVLSEREHKTNMISPDNHAHTVPLSPSPSPPLSSILPIPSRTSKARSRLHAAQVFSVEAEKEK